MKNNNNKLANYIDNVRRLQKENGRMIRQIEVIEESQTKEITDLRHIYDREIEDLKAGIRKMQENYRDLQENSERVLTENQDLKKMQEKKTQVYTKNSFYIERLLIDDVILILGIREKAAGYPFAEGGGPEAEEPY